MSSDAVNASASAVSLPRCEASEVATSVQTDVQDRSASYAEPYARAFTCARASSSSLLGVHVVVDQRVAVRHLRVDGGDQHGVHGAEVPAGHREEPVEDLEGLPRLVRGVGHRPRALEPVLEVLVRVSDRVTQDVDVAHGSDPVLHRPSQGGRVQGRPVMMGGMSLLATWTRGEHAADAVTHPTYTKGSGTGVIVVHEIPG